MEREAFHKAERFMLGCMREGPQIREHVYRVLNHALRLLHTEARAGREADAEVVILSALLHDIARGRNNGTRSHAEAGSQLAYWFLAANGWPEETAAKVRDCIATHSRKGPKPASPEARILFDADKLDITGAVGLVRSIGFAACAGRPVCRLGEDSLPLPGKKKEGASLLRDCRKVIREPLGVFYTREARRMARENQEAARAFYRRLKKELRQNYAWGTAHLEDFVQDRP